MYLQELTEKIIGCAIEVHRHLGPGLLESSYRECLAYELRKAGLKVETEVPIPIIYKEVKLECGYRLDLLVENQIIIELKVVEDLNPVHTAQVMSYMKFSNHRVALLINFKVQVLVKDGLKRFWH